MSLKTKAREIENAIAPNKLMKTRGLYGFRADT
jgi:hypothetical protein